MISKQSNKENISFNKSVDSAMFNLVILISFLLGSFTAEAKLDNRIVGGQDAALGEIPYIVSLRAMNRHGCGASILNEKFVLTAAHCVYGWDHRPDLFSIQYGIIEITEKEPNVLRVKKIIIHEDYIQSGSYLNDIAILEIDGKINFGPNAKPVQLPTPFEDPGNDVDAVLAGWGLQKSGGNIQIFLQKVTLKIFSDDFCQKSVKKYNSDMHICAGAYGGGKGQCTADSGGPLTIDGVQFGVVSWSTKPCASPGNPGILTKVSAQRNWIRRQTGI